VLIIAGLALLLAAATGWTWIHVLLRSAPPTQGRLQVTSLEGPVRVVRDPFGVPHILADHQADAFLALGFAHAQDRFWQMELMRRSASGTLSELFGRSTLEADRLARTLGLRLAAEAEAETLSGQTGRILAAYSAGVNLYLEEAREQSRLAPIELRWLELEPEPWTPADSIALVRLRAWMLGRSLRASLLLDRLVREIGGVASQDFFPVRPIDATPELMGSLLRLGETADVLARVVGLDGRAGSLGFLVGLNRSSSGLPLLANDPHVEFRLPPLFYAVHLNTPEGDLSGGTWPGMPLFWTGTNRDIAWGQVVVHVSVTDLFEETLDPKDPSRYDRRGRWHEVERRVERIQVRDAPPESIEIVHTQNGPLLGSVHPDDVAVRTLALRWTGQDKHSGMEALLRIQGATEWEEFRHALRRFPGPVSTFLFADRKGKIGTQLAGRLPVRAIETGLLPLPGRSRYYNWRGFIPFKDLPQRNGSELPWLVASTHPEDFKFPHGVSWLWKNGGARERLRELLSRKSRLGINEVMAIQRDQHSSQGIAMVQRLLSGMETRIGDAARVRDIMLDWDGSTDSSSLGVSVYHVFRQRLCRLLLQGHVDADMAERLRGLSEPLPGVLIARFVDRAGLPPNPKLVEQALEETWSALSVWVSANPRKWTWGQLHQLRLRHDFEQLGRGPMAWLGRRLSRGPFPVPGDADSVWTMYHRSIPTSDVGVGPAFRYTVDLADVDHARFGLAGGQSGHPGSAHYEDGLQEWLRGSPRPLWTHRSDIEYHQTGVWELVPSSQYAEEQ
jgi:penicillin amidase